MTDQTTSPAALAALTPRKRVVAGITSEILLSAAWESLRKLNPRTLARNPVMFVVEVVSALTTVILIRDILAGHGGIGFTAQIVFWLWFTVIFANFSEAVAEGRGKAQAENLRRTRTQTQAKRLTGTARHAAVRDGLRPRSQGGRSGPGRGGGHDPQRRRCDRRRGLGR